MEQEQKHFQECLDVVRENIRHYKQKVEEGKKETEELYAAFTSGDTELYNQLVVSQIGRASCRERVSHQV